MKTVKFKKFLYSLLVQVSLCGLITVLVSSGYAQSLSNDYFESKDQIERTLRKNLSDVISTKLKKESFNVSVSVKLRKKRQVKAKPNKKKEYEPNDLKLGIFDIEQLTSSYEEQIRLLELKKKDKFNEKYILRSADVSVGLDPVYGEEYIEKFSAWLKEYVNKQISRRATSHVEIIRVPEEAVPEKIDPFKVKPLYEQLKDFQFLLAAALCLLALLLFSLVLILKKSPGKISTTEKSAETDTNPNNVMSGEGADSEDEDDENGLNEKVDLSEEIKKYMRKIVVLALKVGKSVEPIVDTWSKQGIENQVKILILFDAIVSFQEEIDAGEIGEIQSQQVEVLESILAKYSSQIKELFDEISELTDPERLEAAKSTYWGLASLRLLGKESFKVPFSELQRISFEEVKSVVDSQDVKTQSIVMMHLGDDNRREYLKTLKYSDKKNLIMAAINNSKLDKNEMEDIQTSVSILAKSIQQSEKREYLNLFPKTSKVLRSLQPVEEIKMLRDIREESPKSIDIIKTYYSTLAFIDEWQGTYIQKILNVLTTDELIEFFRMAPEAKEPVFHYCSERVKIIVEDGLKLESITSVDKNDEILRSLQSKMNRFISKENITLDELYKKSESAGVSDAA